MNETHRIVPFVAVGLVALLIGAIVLVTLSVRSITNPDQPVQVEISGQVSVAEQPELRNVITPAGSGSATTVEVTLPSDWTEYEKLSMFQWVSNNQAQGGDVPIALLEELIPDTGNFVFYLDSSQRPTIEVSTAGAVTVKAVLSDGNFAVDGSSSNTKLAVVQLN